MILDFSKHDGLVPAIVQDADTHRVLMLGYMDAAALDATLASKHVTFFSRSRQALWTKGSTSGNVLDLVSIQADCDGDAVLVTARPAGPTCHAGTTSCFPAAPGSGLAELDALIAARMRSPSPDSYTAKLASAGVARIAQKVGEEAVETAIAAVASDDETFLGEAADLVFHLLVLLRAKGACLDALEKTLGNRRR
jgi:phosphoribosyl-ATP pyrophosphohydrolase/phosphoribosyl-AMP cyclohydrolase